MARVSRSLVVAQVAALVLLATAFLPAKGDVRAVNHCPFDLTVFWKSQAPNSMSQISLAVGAAQQLNLPAPWVGGVMWASRVGNSDNAQATQLEFNIGTSDNRDFYDISVVNAYNLPVQIHPTYLANGDVASGLECGTTTCVISDLHSVCQLDNVFAGPEPACLNVDGPGNVMTPSIGLFQNHCPGTYTQSNVNQGVVLACDTGSQYDAIWCP